MSSGPALVSILRQGSYLVASVHTALDDSEMIRFRNDLIDQIGRYRSRGVIIDVAALDVLDSFGFNTIRSIAEMARLRGAHTVIVGIQPDLRWRWCTSAWRPGRSPPPSTSRKDWPSSTPACPHLPTGSAVVDKVSPHPGLPHHSPAVPPQT